MIVTFDSPNIRVAKKDAVRLLRVFGYPLDDGSTITIKRIHDPVEELGALLT